MAIVDCRECEKRISSSASACPFCGHPQKRMSSFSKLFWGFMVFCFLAIWVIFKGADSPEREAKTPEQVKERERDEARFRRAVATVTGIKGALRDPASVVWDRIRSNYDATLICIEYRAKNGFGGMVTERITVWDGAINRSAQSWTQFCTGGDLRDISYIRSSL